MEEVLRGRRLIDGNRRPNRIRLAWQRVVLRRDGGPISSGFDAESFGGPRASLDWRKGAAFAAKSSQGHQLEFDAADEAALDPFDALLMSLAGCMAMSVAHALEKMRVGVDALHVDVYVQRKMLPPHGVQKIHLAITARGNDLPAKKVARAVSLAEKKYCTVTRVLQQKIAVESSIRLDEPQCASKSDSDVRDESQVRSSRRQVE